MLGNIQEVTTTNIDELVPLFDEYRQFYDMPSNLALAKEFLLTRIMNKEAKAFIYYSSKNAAGFVQIYPLYSSLALQSTWQLNDLYVKENSRKQRIATKLMSHVVKQAKLHKIFSIKLSTAKTNTIARDLYLSLGFKPNVQFDNYSKLVN